MDPAQFQVMFRMLYRIETRLERMEDALQRNNDLVAALLHAAGIVVNVNQNQIGAEAKVGQVAAGEDLQQTLHDRQTPGQDGLPGESEGGRRADTAGAIEVREL